MKKKSLAALLSGLLTVSLTGVGFASWLITGGDTSSVTDGSVTAEKVEDKRVKITELAVTNGEINFGMSSDYTTTNAAPWLKNDATAADMSANISFKIENGMTYGKSIDFVVEATGDLADEFNTAVNTDKYIKAPTIASITTFTASDAATLYEVELKFEWGDYFGASGNPYTYFNNTYASASTSSSVAGYDKAADEAVAVLSAIRALNGVTYKVTVSTTSK